MSLQDGDDDGSSTISNPYTISSSSLGSRDIDTSTTKSNIAEEFSPGWNHWLLHGILIL